VAGINLILFTAENYLPSLQLWFSYFNTPLIYILPTLPPLLQQHIYKRGLEGLGRAFCSPWGPRLLKEEVE
jgi:hypothetical protein